MQIHVEPDAHSYILEKGGHLILFEAKATGCCGIGSAFVPMLEVGQPQRPPQDYHTLQQDGITIHVDRALEGARGPYRVQLNSFLGWRSVTLSTEGGS